MKHDSNSAVESQQAEQAKLSEQPQSSEPQAQSAEQPQLSGRMGTIYKITNMLNGKGYVGQTKQLLRKRIYKHKSAGKSGRPGIDAAIEKYGWGNFTVEVIEECPVERLSEREIFFIAALKTKAPNGYNLTDGGEGCAGFKHTAESRAKISANHADVSGEKNPQYGNHPSDETRAKISANHADVSGEKNPNYGKPLSDEQKAKLSASRKGKKFGPRSPETCAKISAALKGKPSPSRGIKRSAEARARMSAAQKARWARKKAVENGGK